MDGDDNDIPTIFAYLGIQDGPFDLQEYVKSKRALAEEKNCGMTE